MGPAATIAGADVEIDVVQRLTGTAAIDLVSRSVVRMLPETAMALLGRCRQKPS